MDRTKRITRGISLAVCAMLVIGGLVAAAQADNALGRALHDRKVTVKRLETIHDFRRVARQNLHHQIRGIQAKIQRTGPKARSSRRTVSGSASSSTTWGTCDTGCASGCTSWIGSSLAGRSCSERLRMNLSTWIQTYGVFRTCPVDGTHDVMNNFGVWVIKPGVPKHIHQGNDIMAVDGTPIVAPFDGNAVARTTHSAAMRSRSTVLRDMPTTPTCPRTATSARCGPAK